MIDALIERLNVNSERITASDLLPDTKDTITLQIVTYGAFLSDVKDGNRDGNDPTVISMLSDVEQFCSTVEGHLQG
ncbi:hypothetical protein N0754_18040 [Pseudomonas aeruginosa]|nr:hypothetical protein [Pseudomonas aeruginosa]MCS9764134.1 hypothetical protein [Pseudomonas aeruginosa]MCS9820311.1 hypothetical protein [Pseudomonas aeruginosa]MCT0240892.1 hypothetical protein [Pseudomonas aeruginosa]MCT0528345.1 hypothetical protein [Pseudomonas aeruginosa]